MATRHFLILPAALPAGAEVTVPGSALGWEQTCSFCGAIIARAEPTNEQSAVTEPRYTATLQVAIVTPPETDPEAPGSVTHVATLQPANINWDACAHCGPGVLAPFAALLAGIGVKVPGLNDAEVATSVATEVATAAPHSPDDPGQAGLNPPA